MSSSRQALWWVWRASPRLTTLNALIVFLTAVLPLASLYALKLVIDAAQKAGQSPHGHAAALVGPLALAAGAAAATVALNALSRFVVVAHAHAVSDHMADLMHEKSIAVDLAYYENPAYQDTIHRAQQDASLRATALLNALIALGASLVSLAATALLLLTVEWWVAPPLLAAAAPGIWVRVRHSRRLHRWHRDRTPQQRRHWYYEFLLTRDLHAKELRLLGIGSLLAERSRSLRARLRGERVGLVARRSLAEAGADLLMTLVSYGIFALLALRAAQGALSIGSLALYFVALQRAQSAIGQLLNGLVSLYESQLFVSNLANFLEIEPRLAEPPRPRRVPRPIRGGIAFHEVCLCYPGAQRPAIEDLSLHVAAGEHVALVGENGAGKSTLVKLLCRLYDPDSGAITVDGVDLRELSRERWRRELAVVFQDYACYQLTARENIWLGDVELSREDVRVEAAAAEAGADATIDGLPRGLDTQLGRWFHDGLDLSVGEWQKMALARAFLRQAQVVVLDEPTSALDARAEHELFERFDRLTRGRTAILISHRLSTVRMADRIHLLDGGRIAQSGTHEELLAAGGAYAELFEMQASRYAQPA